MILMHQLKTEGAWVPTKETLGGFRRGFGLVKASVWLITWGRIYLPERKVRNSLDLTPSGRCTNSAPFIECLLCAQLHASWSMPRRVFGWVTKPDRKYHCHVMGICSFKNMNTTQCGGVTNSLERQGSENLLQIQNGEKGCIMRGFGYKVGKCQQIQTCLIERWPGRHLQMCGHSLYLKSNARLP